MLRIKLQEMFEFLKVKDLYVYYNTNLPMARIYISSFLIGFQNDVPVLNRKLGVQMHKRCHGNIIHTMHLSMNFFLFLLLWFLTVTCSCSPYLYFGSAIMLVTYFVNFR